MKLADFFRNNNPAKFTISVEITPPKRGGSAEQIFKLIEAILPYDPKFIDITSHAADVTWEELDGKKFKKRTIRKSPGTFGLCAAIKYRYGIDTVPHLLCGGFTVDETEDALIELNYLGIENVLAIRGDKEHKPNETRPCNRFAADLVEQIRHMNNGVYLSNLDGIRPPDFLDRSEFVKSTPTNFCIGVSAYPEKHFEAPNLMEDLGWLTYKVVSGAEYAVTQMFFDNQKFYHYVEKAKQEMAHLESPCIGSKPFPIIPGLKILSSVNQLKVLPKTFFIDIPNTFVDQVKKAAIEGNDSVKKVGIDWCVQQCQDLISAGHKHLHFYIMQNANAFIEVMKRLQ